MRYSINLTILVVVCLLVAGCNDNQDGGSSANQPSESERSSGSGALYINLLDAGTEPDIDMTGMMGMLLYATLDVEIGNSGGESIDFDEVRVIFSRGNRFVTGTRCGHAMNHMVCVCWQNENRIPEFPEQVESISIPPKQATTYLLKSCEDFNIDYGTDKSAEITVLLRGRPLASARYDFFGGNPQER